MGANHIEILVEEPSMEAFLRALLPRLLPQGRTFEVHPFQGKPDLLARLPGRLAGYAHWLPEDWRVLVVVDRDGDDCRELRARLEGIALSANLRTRSSSGSKAWQVVNRIANEELEAWYFGDWQGVRSAYPKVGATVASQAKYREPDGIAGGTWEAFERVMQKCGYFGNGLAKIEAARSIGAHLDPIRGNSRSFKHYGEAVMEAFA